MKVIVVIPARYASTRFEGKPLAEIAGKPMIQMVYENVRRAENVTDVIVATDDGRIVDAIERIGGKAMLTSETNRSGTDRVSEAAGEMNMAENDIAVNVQGDQPLIHPDCIDEAVRPFFNEPDIEMSTLAYKIVNPEEISNPKDVKVVFDNEGFALYFSRSPIPCARDSSTGFDTYKHLGVYAYTRRFLDIFRSLPEGRLESIEKLEQLRAIEHGHKIKVAVTPHDSPEVDIPEDIQRIERILAATRNTRPSSK